ncbi:MAG: glycosyltransferase family 2 protein [Armatimonadota bacterium]
MKLEIVCHCWNYSRMLMYQLSSIALYPPQKVQLTMTVFYNEEDKQTCRVLDYFKSLKIDNVIWNWKQLDQPHLFRRAIGRNIAALETKADWVFFTDCDYVFRDGCLDSISQLQELKDVPLVFPGSVNSSAHIKPDAEIFTKADDLSGPIDINPNDFGPVPCDRAIGGIQIAKGDIVRQIGYCKDDARFMKPMPRFQRCREDVVFRKLIGSEGMPIDIPNIYRIRHKEKGRSLVSWLKSKFKL